MTSFQTLSGEEKYGVPPDSVEMFIKLLQTRNNKLQEELATTEVALRLTPSQEDNDEWEEDGTKISTEEKEKVMLCSCFFYTPAVTGIGQSGVLFAQYDLLDMG